MSRLHLFPHVRGKYARRSSPYCRRGSLLVLVIVTIALVGGLITVLALYAAQFHRDRQADRIRNLARAITDSAVSYSRVHGQEWTAQPPDAPIKLDVQALLPAGITGSAELTFITAPGRRVCHVSSTAAWGGIAAGDELDVDLASQGSASSPS